MNECSGLCSCSEDDTMYLRCTYLFGGIGRPGAGNTGAVFYSLIIWVTIKTGTVLDRHKPYNLL